MKRLALLSSILAVAAGPLPDATLTPGVERSDLSLHDICTTQWGKDARHVSSTEKQKVFTEYGYLLGNKDSRCSCEIDHLISRELGGADDVRNLWVQPYRGPWNAHMKDRLENRLHIEVCAGRLDLHAAQTGIAHDWTQLYRRYFPQ